MANTTISGPEPVHLTAPAAPARAVPGCDVCEALVKQRGEGYEAGDMSAVSDCNVELRNHPHGGAR
ncbi:hypothetical protein [Streptomyces sp. NPDC089919]|uniref:hypothetical protein n=1 Tax=Streptomyces sp. NPDC089919 TaxID=3155188 RepID=UPI00344A05A8